MRNDWVASNVGDDTSGCLTSSYLGQSVGLSLGLSLSIVGSVGMIGRVDSRNMMDQRSESPGVVTVVDGSDDTSCSLTSSYLGQGVGLSLGLPLSVVDVGENSRYVVGQRNSSNVSDSSLGSVGDDTNVVKTTFSDGVPHRLPSSHLSHSPGLGIPCDGRHHQAQLHGQQLYIQPVGGRHF